MNKKDFYNRTKKLLKQHYPESYKQYLKGINQPKSFYDWRKVFLSNVGDYLFINHLGELMTPNHREMIKSKVNNFKIGESLIKREAKTLFLSNQIINSLLKSSGTLDVNDIKNKEQTYLFMLPKNNPLVSPESKRNLQFLTVSHNPEKTEYNVKNARITFSYNDDFIYTLAGDGGLFYDSSQYSSKEIIDNDLSRLGMLPEDHDFNNTLISLAFKLYWLVGSKPELITEENSGGFGDNRKPTLWLGKNYQIQKESDCKGFNASKATHIRKGHFRRQPCGEGRKDRKLIWLEPMLINGDKELTGVG